jgi:hypothetical protein
MQTAGSSSPPFAFRGGVFCFFYFFQTAQGQLPLPSIRS